MSYDIRLGVKVEGGNNLFAVIDEPSEYKNPTYNLGKMFRECTGRNFEQGRWYKVSDVLPLIEKGVRKLKFSPQKYRRFEPENGWGTVESALQGLEAMLECIRNNTETSCMTWNAIPIELMYVAW